MNNKWVYIKGRKKLGEYPSEGKWCSGQYSGLEEFQELSSLAWKIWHEAKMTFIAVWSSRFVASDLLREGKVSSRPQRDWGNQCPRVPISMVNKSSALWQVGANKCAFDKLSCEIKSGRGLGMTSDIEARLSNGKVNYRLQKFLGLLAPTQYARVTRFSLVFRVTVGLRETRPFPL